MSESETPRTDAIEDQIDAHRLSEGTQVTLYRSELERVERELAAAKVDVERLRERAEYWKQKHDDEETGAGNLKAFKAGVLRCRYPVCTSLCAAGFGWDIPRLNEVVDAALAKEKS
jgi:hypothetical protein